MAQEIWNSEDEWIAGLTAAMLAASRRQDEQATAPEPAIDVTVLHAKIGELTLANDFLAGALGSEAGAGCGAFCRG